MLVDRTDRQLDMGLPCFGCGTRTHDVDRCPRLHLIVDHMTLLHKHMYSRPHQREEFERGTRRSTNARFGRKLFEEAAQYFQLDDSIVDESEVIRESHPLSVRSVRTSKHSSNHSRKRSRSLNSLHIQDSDKYVSDKSLNVESLSAIM